MTDRDDSCSVSGVAGGRLDPFSETVVLEFEARDGPIRLSLPVTEVAALLSVCIGLAGQDLPSGGAAEHATIPVADWRVGVSELKALVLGLAPQAGGALAFHLSAPQAREMASALLRGAEIADGASTRSRH